MRIERVEERRFYEIEATHQDLGQMQMYVNYYDRHTSMQRLTPALSARQSLAASQGEGMDSGV